MKLTHTGTPFSQGPSCSSQGTMSISVRFPFGFFSLSCRFPRCLGKILSFLIGEVTPPADLSQQRGVVLRQQVLALQFEEARGDGDLPADVRFADRQAILRAAAVDDEGLARRAERLAQAADGK